MSGRVNGQLMMMNFRACQTKILKHELLARTYDATETAAQLARAQAPLAPQQERRPSNFLPAVGESIGAATTVRVVRNLTQADFRSRLVEHFDILFNHGATLGRRIEWPVYKKDQFQGNSI